MYILAGTDTNQEDQEAMRTPRSSGAAGDKDTEGGGEAPVCPLPDGLTAGGGGGEVPRKPLKRKTRPIHASSDDEEDKDDGLSAQVNTDTAVIAPTEDVVEAPMMEVLTFSTWEEVETYMEDYARKTYQVWKLYNLYTL